MLIMSYYHLCYQFLSMVIDANIHTSARELRIVVQYIFINIIIFEIGQTIIKIVMFNLIMW